MAATATRTIRQFVNRHNVRIVSTLRTPTAEERAAHGRDHGFTAWTVTIKLGRRQLTTPYTMGSGCDGEPDIEDVLDCLISDTAGLDSFEEWCGDYGYDTDSRTGERLYNTLVLQAKNLRRFLSDDQYAELESCERL